MPKSSSCVVAAWKDHQGEVRRFLAHRLGDEQLAQDLLQDVFVKGMRQGSRFCEIRDPRAWLFQVARNALIDHFRLAKEHAPLPDDLPEPETEPRPPVDRLSECLDRVLSEIPPADAEILRACDLAGIHQKEFAASRGLSLAAAKSRLLRARARLRQALMRSCKVELDAAGRVCSHVPRRGRADPAASGA